MNNKNILFKLLVEGTRDKMFQKYADILATKGVQITASQLKDTMRKKLTTEAGMNSMSLPSSYFLSGVTKLYFNGELTTNKRVALLYPNMKITDKFDYLKCKKLNKIIIDLRNIFIDSEGQQWDVPEDFGDLSLDDIFKKYKKLIKGMDAEAEDEEQKPKELSTDLGNYSFEIMYQHKDAEKYGPYTQPGQWCITQPSNDYYFNYYTRNNNTFFVIFKRKGWETEKRQVGKNYPLDSYGTSLLAAQIKQADGRFYCCTTRWNHGNHDSPNIPDADFAVSRDYFMQITGCDANKLKEIQAEWVRVSGTIPKQEVPKSKETLEILRKFKYCAIQINNGQNPVLPGHEMFNKIYKVDGTPNNGRYDNEGNLKWNRGINAARLVSDNRYKCWNTIIDNGKLKPETLVNGEVKTLSYIQYELLSKFYKTDSEEEKRVKNILGRFICLKTDYRENKFKLYDSKMHTLLKIGTKTVFDNYYGANELMHLFIKVGTKQYSIIDLNTGKTLKAPNGNDVFENIIKFGSTYNNRIKDKYDTHRKLFIVGDSANKECYYYDETTGQICEFPKTKDGKSVVPVLGEESFIKSDLFIAAKSPIPNDRKYRGSFDNDGNGTYIYSKSEDMELSIPGVENPESHNSRNGVDTFMYLEETGDKYSRNYFYVAVLCNGKKVFRLPDGRFKFRYVEINPTYNENDNIMTVSFNEDNSRSYRRYREPVVVVRISDGKMLTKNGFSDNECESVVSVNGIDRNENLFLVEFESGDIKFYSSKYNAFMKLENGEDTCARTSGFYSNVEIHTKSGEDLTYHSVEDFVKSLTPESSVNENFNRLANYKLKLL